MSLLHKNQTFQIQPETHGLLWIAFLRRELFGAPWVNHSCFFLYLHFNIFCVRLFTPDTNSRPGLLSLDSIFWVRLCFGLDFRSYSLVCTWKKPLSLHFTLRLSVFNWLTTSCLHLYFLFVCLNVTNKQLCSLVSLCQSPLSLLSNSRVRYFLVVCLPELTPTLVFLLIFALVLVSDRLLGWLEWLEQVYQSMRLRAAIQGPFLQLCSRPGASSVPGPRRELWELQL